MTVGEPWCLRCRVVDRAANHRIHQAHPDRPMDTWCSSPGSCWSR